MKAILLARVSTEEQREAGNSLPAQVRRLEEYCKRKGFAIAKRYSFDESAYKTKRDEFDKAIEEIKKNKERIALCFDKVDRFTRNVFDKRVPFLYEMAMKGNIELHFVSDNIVIHENISAVEKFHFGISLNLAKYYSDAVSDNTRRALEQKLRKGEWTGQACLGYMKTQDKDIILDPIRADLVAQMFSLYATGNYSIKTLKKEMGKLGLTSRNGNPIPTSMIHHTLRNKFYMGIMTSKGREYPHKYTRIISESDFKRVQDILQGYNKKKIKYASKPFIFRGLIKCEKCGCTVTGEIKKGKYIYYSCSNYKGNCHRIWIPESELLAPVKKVFSNMVLPQEKADRLVEILKKSSEEKNAFHTKTISRLQSEYNSLQKSLDRLVDLLVNNSITQEIYDRKVNEYKEKQYDINIQLEEYTKADENYHIVAGTLFSLASRAWEIFESSEVEEKRQLLNFVLQNSMLKGKNLLFEVRSPFKEIIMHKDDPTMLRR